MVSVSILVFLDSSLKRSGSVGLRDGYRSFNPCFSGFFSKTEPMHRRRWRGDRVSILVFLDSSLKPDLQTQKQAVREMVSILVFLDSSLKPDASQAGPSCHTIVSILVFLDSSLKPRIGTLIRIIDTVSILVFLDSSLKL